jgi:hypothetical protein
VAEAVERLLSKCEALSSRCLTEADPYRSHCLGCKQLTTYSWIWKVTAHLDHRALELTLVLSGCLVTPPPDCLPCGIGEVRMGLLSSRLTQNPLSHSSLSSNSGSASFLQDNFKKFTWCCRALVFLSVNLEHVYITLWSG